MSAPISSRQSERLDRARGLLDRAHRTAEDRGRARPRPEVVPAAAILPVAPALAGLLPHGGLRRGSTVLVRSSTSLLFAVLAEASTQGTWRALVTGPAAHRFLGRARSNLGGYQLVIALTPTC